MESQPQKRDALYCPDCGAEIPSSAVRCWRCRHPFPNGPKAECTVAKMGGGENHIEDGLKLQFSLASLMLIVTLTAILFSIYEIKPGLGIVLFILAGPALLRTVVLALQKGSRNTPMTTAGKIGFFLLWMGLAGIAAAVAGTIFYVAFISAVIASCFAGGTGNSAGLLTLGGVIAASAAISLFVLFWRVTKF